jgi:hypothetical protein
MGVKSLLAQRVWLSYRHGLGAGASNVFAGFVVQVFGYPTGLDGSSSRSDRRIQPRSSKIMRGTSMAIGFVPEGQHDSSQARSAWNHEENTPSQRDD